LAPNLGEGASMRGDRPAELVIGSVQLGLPYGVANRSGQPARETALRLVRKAADAGIAQFDTARAYGDAEGRLGEALAGRRAVHTITKLSPLTQLPANASRDAVCAAVDDSIAESLAALRLTQLPCLLLHRAGHLTAFNGAVWDRLIEHLEDGSVLTLGVSVQSPAEAFAALDHADIRHIQLPFNLLDWRWREAGVIDALMSRPGVTVHARSVFLQGLLAADDAALWPPVPGIAPGEMVRWLNVIAQEHGRVSTADLALAFARGQSWIDGVVVGMETIDQLDANLRLAARRPLDPFACMDIEMRRPRVPEQLLDPAQWPK
jgi:aryl-alcohol dehydrogenase-like predicted oxidoreductase